MDIQLIRYLDGELAESEAHVFLERLEREPELREALEEEERLLEAARGLFVPTPPPDFTERVMQSLPTALPDPARPRGARPRRWMPLLSAAALVLLAFALGRISLPTTTPLGSETTLHAEGLAESTHPGASSSHGSAASFASQAIQRPDFSAIDSRTGGSYRIVHLVYAPESDTADRVSVAGTFNGWDMGQIPMRREADAWTATLILPPGSYEYMFVEDGERWVTDPRSPRTRDDGFGGSNAVVDVDA